MVVKMWQMRVLLATLTVSTGLMAYGFDATDAIEVMWPALWGPALLCVAVSCFIFMLLPRSEFFYLLTGLVPPCLYLGRLVAVAANQNAGVYATPDRAFLAWGLWGGYLILWIVAWTAALGPTHSKLKHERE